MGFSPKNQRIRPETALAGARKSSENEPLAVGSDVGGANLAICVIQMDEPHPS
jgi:Ethanolamine utilization protein EutJ (predicted chaperonin)